MKVFVILTSLLAAQAFADTAYMKLGDIKGESQDTATEEVVEGDLLNAPVIDHAEESAEEVKDAVHQPGNGATGQARRRGDVKMEDISVVRELDKSSTKAPTDGGNLIDQHRQRATDHNSSRSNKTSSSRKLDTDDDNDGIDTEACNAVDNDCDDARAESAPKD